MKLRLSKEDERLNSEKKKGSFHRKTGLDEKAKSNPKVATSESSTTSRREVWSASGGMNGLTTRGDRDSLVAPDGALDAQEADLVSELIGKETQKHLIKDVSAVKTGKNQESLLEAQIP